MATRDDERLATYLMMLAFILAMRDEFDEAVARGEEALAIFQVNHGVDHPFVRQAESELGRMRRGEAPSLDR